MRVVQPKPRERDSHGPMTLEDATAADSGRGQELECTRYEEEPSVRTGGLWEAGLITASTAGITSTKLYGGWTAESDLRTSSRRRPSFK